MIESDRYFDRYRSKGGERKKKNKEISFTRWREGAIIISITSITSSSSIRGIASLINGGILCLVSGFERCRSSILEHLAVPLSYASYERNMCPTYNIIRVIGDKRLGWKWNGREGGRGGWLDRLPRSYLQLEPIALGSPEGSSPSARSPASVSVDPRFSSSILSIRTHYPPPSPCRFDRIHYREQLGFLTACSPIRTFPISKLVQFVHEKVRVR